jgi:predicted adenylyl cyclase CyaB
VTTHDELEVKAPVADPEAVVHSLLAVGAQRVFLGEMIDRRFDRDGRLESRDEVLRLRVYRRAGGEESWGVLGWKGPKSLHGGYRRRAESETRVVDPEAAIAILEHLGFAVVYRIDRRIEQLTLGDATIRIERYPEMDVLVEIEGSPQSIEAAIAASGVPRADFVAESLPYFLDAYERRTGRPGRVARQSS